MKSGPYTITLTTAEGLVLMHILNRIGGRPDASDRKHADEIHNKLASVGVPHPRRSLFRHDDGDNVIFFASGRVTPNRLPARKNLL